VPDTPDAPDVVAALQGANAQLRAENAELKAQLAEQAEKIGAPAPSPAPNTIASQRTS
jgi:hypothetical protein